MPPINHSKKKPELISTKMLMGMIGILGILFSVLVITIGTIGSNCSDFQHSLSAYYHTGGRDIFVGILCAMALAFFAYKGYDEAGIISDQLAGNFAAIFALGVAFFPTGIDEMETTSCIGSIIDTGASNTVHYVSAVLLFVTLAYFCFFQFTKSEYGSYWQSDILPKLNKQKITENRIYISCGSIMLLCMILTGIYFWYQHKYDSTFLSEWRIVTIMETIMILAFSVAWIRKSDFLGMVED